MPSVCSIAPDNTAIAAVPGSANPAEDTPVKQLINVVDKKVRNLEKRKVKLDDYKQRVAEGQELIKDQKEALAKYEVVMQSLEFAHDIQKQFQSISNDFEKQRRKQAKRDRLLRHQYDVARTLELLRLQSVLACLRCDETKQDFIHGRHNAPVLSECDVKEIEQWSSLVSPLRLDDKSYSTHLEAAIDHLTSYLDDRDTADVGPNYKNIKRIVQEIASSSSYWSRYDATDTSAAQTTIPTVHAPLPDTSCATLTADSSAHSHNVLKQQTSCNDNKQPTTTTVSDQQPQQLATVELPPTFYSKPTSHIFDDSHAASLCTDNTSSSLLLSSFEPRSSTDFPSVVNDGDAETVQVVAVHNGAAGEAEASKQFDEIVSSTVEGGYHFLQDSEIEQEEANHDFSPHQDMPLPTNPAMTTSSSHALLMQHQYSAPHHYIHVPYTVSQQPTAIVGPDPSYLAQHGIAYSQPMTMGATDYMMATSLYNTPLTSHGYVAVSNAPTQSYYDPTSGCCIVSAAPYMNGGVAMNGGGMDRYMGEGVQAMYTAPEEPGQELFEGEEGDGLCFVGGEMLEEGHAENCNGSNDENKKPFAMNPHADEFKSKYSSPENSEHGGSDEKRNKTWAEQADDDEAGYNGRENRGNEHNDDGDSAEWHPARRYHNTSHNSRAPFNGYAQRGRPGFNKFSNNNGGTYYRNRNDFNDRGDGCRFNRDEPNRFNRDAGGRFNREEGGRFNRHEGGRFNEGEQNGGRFNRDEGGRYRHDNNGYENGRGGGDGRKEWASERYNGGGRWRGPPRGAGGVNNGINRFERNFNKPPVSASASSDSGNDCQTTTIEEN